MTPDAQFLHAFHTAHPGSTPAAISHWKVDDTERSSYDIIAEFLSSQAGGEVVLDLACGDGVLAEQLLNTDGGPLAVIGVDASPAELKKARRRLRKRAVLHNGLAHIMPIPNAEVAAVGCHMALTLMRPIEDVIDEIARVLVPGGVLGAFVGPVGVAEPALQTFQRLLKALPAEHRRERPELGDPRAASAAELQALLAPYFSRIEITPHRLWADGTAAALWPSLEQTYDAFALTDDGRAALKAAFFDELGERTLRCGYGVLQVRAWRSDRREVWSEEPPEVPEAVL